MTEILHPFLTKFRQILRGILDQYFLEKERFRKSGSASPPHGMKLGNTFSGHECSPRLINKRIRRVGEYYDRQREVGSYLHFMLYVPLILPIHCQWTFLNYKENFPGIAFPTWRSPRNTRRRLTAVCRQACLDSPVLGYTQSTQCCDVRFCPSKRKSGK